MFVVAPIEQKSNEAGAAGWRDVANQSLRFYNSLQSNLVCGCTQGDLLGAITRS